MQTSTLEQAKPLPSVFDRFPAPATQPQTAVSLRRLGFWSSLLVVPAAYAIGRLTGARRAGSVVGGLALLGLGALRWQLARWFTETPAYETLLHVGDIEVRRYPFRIDARTEVQATDFDTAYERGYSRLECFVYGANDKREHIECVTPVLTSMHDGVYTMSFVMPPERSVASLPHPADMRVTLREVPEHRVAVFPIHGELTAENLVWREREFLRKLVDAGLVAKGSIKVATYDASTTLPALRKTELWIEIV